MTRWLLALGLIGNAMAQDAVWYPGTKGTSVRVGEPGVEGVRIQLPAPYESDGRASMERVGRDALSWMEIGRLWPSGHLCRVDVYARPLDQDAVDVTSYVGGIDNCPENYPAGWIETFELRSELPTPDGSPVPERAIRDVGFVYQFYDRRGDPIDPVFQGLNIRAQAPQGFSPTPVWEDVGWDPLILSGPEYGTGRDTDTATCGGGWDSRVATGVVLRLDATGSLVGMKLICHTVQRRF